MKIEIDKKIIEKTISLIKEKKIIDINNKELDELELFYQNILNKKKKETPLKIIWI